MHTFPKRSEKQSNDAHSKSCGGFKKTLGVKIIEKFYWKVEDFDILKKSEIFYCDTSVYIYDSSEASENLALLPPPDLCVRCFHTKNCAIQTLCN